MRHVWNNKRKRRCNRPRNAWLRSVDGKKLDHHSLTGIEQSKMVRNRLSVTPTEEWRCKNRCHLLKPRMRISTKITNAHQGHLHLETVPVSTLRKEIDFDRTNTEETLKVKAASHAMPFSIVEGTIVLYLLKRIEGDLIQSYDEWRYTNRKFNNQLTTQKRYQNFDNTTIAYRLRTLSQ